MSQRQDTDIFEIIGKIPKGRSYQWIAESVLGQTGIVAHRWAQAKENGWKPVPAHRHPKMLCVGKRIVQGGQVLMENSTIRVKNARAKDIQAALTMFGEHPIGKYISKPINSADTRWTAQEPIWGPIPATDGKPRIIEVAVTLKLSHNLVEAAAVCALSVEEYARRMMALILRGDLDGILVPTLERDAYEVRYLTTTEK